jgi:diguanylate cyclase (GGDEF)-like protein
VDPLTATAAIAAAIAAAGAWHLAHRAQRAERQVETLRRELNAEHHAASHDPLTDLLNRRAFYQKGLAVVPDPTRHPLVALVIDLDRFKQVNDHFGHAAGDEVLAAIARRFATYADGNLVARLGGDEFAGLFTLPNADSHLLHQFAVELSQVLSVPISLGDHVISVTASIGLATVRGPDIAHFAEALREADHHMYRVKAASRAAHRRHTTEPTPHTAVRSAAPGRGSLTHHAVRSSAAAERHQTPPPAGPSRPPRTPDVQRR